MHNPTLYRATFRDLKITAFDKEQVLKLRIQLTMYQLSSSPGRWTFTPTLPTGQPHLEAASPDELSLLIEGLFVTRETVWDILPGGIPSKRVEILKNVVPINKRRRA